MVLWKIDDRTSIEVCGINVKQSWHDLFFVNCILQYNKFDVIIELGAGAGAGTLFLALNGDAPVHTFDTRGESRNPKYRQLKELFGITHYQMDIFTDEATELVKRLLKRKRALLYCDNGDKDREFNHFAPYLENGDVILAHDARREIKMPQIIETVKKYNLKPFHQEEADKIGASIFSFKKEKT